MKCNYKASHLKLTMPGPTGMRLPWVTGFSGQSTKVCLTLNVADLAHKMQLLPITLYILGSAREGERARCVTAPGARDTALPYSLLGWALS